ncbi:MAG TPA: hypothetical protein VJU16_03225 [Planctomycetota bacterium]|nr:hypothetical protein [Planctomycetota bacterium]
MRSAAAAAALLILAGCSVPSGDRERPPRNLKYGLFYDAVRPESSKQADIDAQLRKGIEAPEVDKDYDISKIRAPRQNAEIADDAEMAAWKASVLAPADPATLRQMRTWHAARLKDLEARLADMNGYRYPVVKGQIEPLRRQVDDERTMVAAIEAKIQGSE